MTEAVKNPGPVSYCKGVVRVVARSVARGAVKGRYVWLAVTATIFTERLVAAWGPHRFNDWIVFEAAARSIVHYHHLPAYGGNPLGVYARLPFIQIGPPAILPVALVQALSPWTVSRLFVGVMVGLCFLAIGAVELAARTAGRAVRRDVAGPAVLVGGLILIVAWSYCTVVYHHLDDAMALSFSAVACWLIARGRPWWLIGLLMGTAIAAKPWAVILTPVLLALPRPALAKAVLVVVGVAAAWWAPFVIGGPGTSAALGGYHVQVHHGSVFELFGLYNVDVQRWLRPVQFLGGAAAGLFCVRRCRVGWLAAPLAALAVRVLTDPFSWEYYGLGPILFALMWDLARPNARRLPIYTLITGAIEGLIPRVVIVPTFGPATAKAYFLGVSKLLWGIGVLVALALELRRIRGDDPELVAAAPPDVPPGRSRHLGDGGLRGAPA